MNLNSSFIIVIAVITLVVNTDAFLWRWRRSKKNQPRQTHKRDSEADCPVGQCVKLWNCPKYAKASEPKGRCAHFINGPWVCCIHSVDNNLYRPNEPDNYWTKATANPTLMPFTRNPKETQTTRLQKVTMQPWLRKSPTPATKKPELDLWGEPCSDEVWDRNARGVPTTRTNPWKRTTANAWNRPSTPDVRNQPTRTSENWKKTTVVMPVRYPTYTPNRKKTTTQWEMTSSWTTKTSDSWPKPSTSDWKKPTKNPWASHSTSTQSTKRTTVILPKSSSNPWGVRPTVSQGVTKVTGRSSTGHAGWITPKTTQPSWIRNQTKSSTRTNAHWTPSDERRNVIGGRSTTQATGWNTQKPGFTRSTTQTEHSGTMKPGVVRFTTSLQSPVDNNRRVSTKKIRVTTPMPNVNIYHCGIRGNTPVTNRQGRNYRSNPDAEIVFPESGEMGSRRPYQRIVGGKEAEPYSWPWVAALYKVTATGGNRFLSAGSLINENFVLTAAHVFTPDDLRSSSYVVMLGTHTAKDAVAEYLVSFVLQHPEYEKRYYYHDIALLKLQQPVKFNDYVMPVCLPSPNAPLLRDKDLVGKNVTVMGWGDDSFGGVSSRVLKEATFPIVSRHACNASYIRVASNRFPKGITENMLCAGAPDGGKDACQGDSGGPLTSIENGRFTQVGIVSFGYKCGDKEFPGVYTKVAPYLSWIADNTQNVDYYDDYSYHS